MKTAEIDVTLIDHMGSDLSVVNAARVSFAKESELEWSNEIHDYLLSHADTKLIDYLAKHNHWSPFAHAFATFRIKAPIFVARQLVKHQVGLAWNEVSRRYVDNEPEFFFPETWRGRPEGSIKQGSAGVITGVTSDEGVDIDPTGMMENAARAALNAYTWALEGGIAPEQARMILPQNMMTEWIWSGSLMAFARVCNLRLDSHAQPETGEVAAQIATEMAELFPVSWRALSK
jgi:thymidylate synthase (FAD)